MLSPTNSLLVRNVRQLVTLRGPSGSRRGAALQDLGIVENGAVLIRGETIVVAGPAHEVEALPEARQAQEIDVKRSVVMPGFVDSHTHLVFGPPRLADYEMRLRGASYADIAAAGGGILWSVHAVRSTPEAELEAQARGFLAAMMRHGTTTIEAKSGYGLDLEGELKTLRVISRLDSVVPTYLGPHVVPPEFSGNADGYIEWVCSTALPEVVRQRIARFVDIYCDNGAFAPQHARRCLTAARDSGLLLKLHGEQFTRTGATQVGVGLGAVSVDHLEAAAEEDIEALARSDTIATLLPGSVFHLGLQRYAPARALIDAGVAVALATDFNPGTSPTFSMQMVISLACREMRMTPAEAIVAATINGAHALRLADRAGSIEPGKQADLAILDVEDYRDVPHYFGVNQVRITIRKGSVIAS